VYIKGSTKYRLSRSAYAQQTGIVAATLRSMQVSVLYLTLGITDAHQSHARQQPLEHTDNSTEEMLYVCLYRNVYTHKAQHYVS
jgi:hypothetical protein